MSKQDRFSFNVPNISDEEILDYLNRREHITVISFLSPKTGIPHMCPVWGIFLNGKYYAQTEDYVLKAKTIEKGNNKLGISVIAPDQFPDYSAGNIPYISLGGTTTIRTKEEFSDFEKIIKLIMQKYIEDKKEREKVTTFVLTEVKTRVLLEITPEWIKAVKVPEQND